MENKNNALVEFLGYLYEEDLKWYEEIRSDYKERGYEQYIMDLRKGNITKTVLKIAQMTRKEAEEMFTNDLNKRYAKLVLTVSKKVGEIKHIEEERNWNKGFDGIITGENGTCHLQTILAGGYNVQRLHYRTLCK